MLLKDLIDYATKLKDADDDFFYWLEEVDCFATSIECSNYVTRIKKIISKEQACSSNCLTVKATKSKILGILRKIQIIENERYISKNINVPLLSIFNDSRIAIVQREFESAVSSYQNHLYQQSVIESVKALESMMKTICEIKGIAYNEKITFDNIAKLLVDNGILPFNGILSGQNVIRNKSSAHGATTTSYITAESDAMLELNRSASALLYLYEKGLKDTI